RAVHLRHRATRRSARPCGRRPGPPERGRHRRRALDVPGDGRRHRVAMSTVFVAHYLDGQTPVRRRAVVRVAATGLEIQVEGGAPLWWPLGAIRQTQGIYAGEQIRLERGGATSEVLVVDDPALLAAVRSIGVAGRRFHVFQRRSLRVLVTALAAPGGHILVLRGLLERTRTPEELAGVLAHEIQHVYHRHPTRLIVQHTSAGLLVGAVAGDVSALMAYSLEAARILGTLRYSRQYEAEADAAGLRMLATARVDPRGLSSFLGQLVPAEKGAPPTLAYFASHPATAERITTLQRLAAEVRDTPTPIVTSRDWKDIARLCGA